jgi:BCD family chlorophyll transporter-like MFS transporter
MSPAPLGWTGIVRLGLVQSALGAVVALCASTLNRVMVVECALPVLLPAALVAWHYLVQLSRPRWGHGSDVGRRRTPWIIGGMGVLAIGAMTAVDAVAMMAHSPITGALLALVAYTLIGSGVGAAGTSLLALLASRTAPMRRPAAAAITWIMMILGIVIASASAGKLLDPFSFPRLAEVVTGVCGVAFIVTLFAVWGVEREAETPLPAAAKPPFREAMAQIWADPLARRFTLFVLVSMMAYSAQELILEPFAGLVFGMTPGQSASLSSVMHGGVLLGMILVGAAGGRIGDRKALWMRRWTIAGCLGSSLALLGLASASLVGRAWPLPPTVFALGFANGVFAVSAIGSMMGLAGAGGSGQEGARMGVWGGAQALGFAIGGFLGAAGVDALRAGFHHDGRAFLVVFLLQAGVFLAAAALAGRIAPAPAADGLAGPSSLSPLDYHGARS